MFLEFNASIFRKQVRGIPGFNFRRSRRVFTIPTTLFAGLTTSIVPSNAGDATATFTRALAAHQTDFEGKLNLVPSGAVRMQGARYVRNYIPAAGTGSASLADGANKTVTVGVGTFIFSMGAVAAANTVITFTGTATGLPVGTLTANATNRTSVAMTITVGGTVIMTASVAGAVDLQFEDTTGQANQNPSEYVSVGVLSTPWHGAGVDGVKYFNTLNGNTVASNVVTEATGSQITSALAEAAGGVTAGVVDAYGPLGYLAEGARTNLALQSQTFSVSGGGGWDVTGATVSADQVAAPDGMTTADKIVEAAVSQQTHGIYAGTAITVSNGATVTISNHFKAGERTWAFIDHFWNATSHFTWFDLSTGAVGTTAAGATASIVALPNGWYRCIVTMTITGTSVSAAFYSSNGDNNGAYLGDITKGIYAWGAQLEAASFASTYIPTTTVAVARPVDSDTYPTAGNFSDTQGTMYAEVSQTSWANAAGSAIGSATQGMMPIADHSGVQGYDGTNTVQGAVGAPSGVVKMAVSWSGTTMTVVADGGTPTVGTYDGTWNLTSLGIGLGGFGTARAIRIYPDALSIPEMKALTT